MYDYFDLFILAQSGDNAAEETKELLTKITTFKVTQGLIVLSICYITLKLIDWLVGWISERIAKEWRLRVKQLLPSKYRSSIVAKFCQITF